MRSTLAILALAGTLLAVAAPALAEGSTAVPPASACPFGVLVHQHADTDAGSYDINVCYVPVIVPHPGPIILAL